MLRRGTDAGELRDVRWAPRDGERRWKSGVAAEVGRTGAFQGAAPYRGWLRGRRWRVGLGAVVLFVAEGLGCAPAHHLPDCSLVAGPRREVYSGPGAAAVEEVSSGRDVVGVLWRELPAGSPSGALPVGRYERFARADGSKVASHVMGVAPGYAASRGDQLLVEVLRRPGQNNCHEDSDVSLFNGNGDAAVIGGAGFFRLDGYTVRLLAFTDVAVWGFSFQWLGCPDPASDPNAALGWVSCLVRGDSPVERSINGWSVSGEGGGALTTCRGHGFLVTAGGAMREADGSSEACGMRDVCVSEFSPDGEALHVTAVRREEGPVAGWNEFSEGAVGGRDTLLVFWQEDVDGAYVWRMMALRSVGSGPVAVVGDVRPDWSPMWRGDGPGIVGVSSGSGFVVLAEGVVDSARSIGRELVLLDEVGAAVAEVLTPAVPALAATVASGDVVHTTAYRLSASEDCVDVAWSTEEEGATPGDVSFEVLTQSFCCR